MNVADNKSILPYQSRKYNMLKPQPSLIIKPRPCVLPEMTPVDLENCEKSDPFASGNFTRPPERTPLPNLRLDDEGDPNTLRSINTRA